MRNLFINGWRRKTREPQQVSLDALPESGASLLTAVGSGSGAGTYTAAPDAWATPAGRSAVSTSNAAAAPSPERVVLNRAEEDAVLRAVAGLPREFRDVVVLSDVNGLSYQEIAERLEVPVGTVRSRLSRGRKRVQQALHAWQQDPVPPVPAHPRAKTPVLA
jgi:RNA polymerase sigma factor (sigma-70 family)